MTTPRIEEMVEKYAEGYKGILPPELIETSKNYWRTELQKVRQETLDEAVEIVKRVTIEMDSHGYDYEAVDYGVRVAQEKIKEALQDNK